ncbi:deoxycytidine triphosphate deaminase [Oceanisphaera psychrotolerans]|uniref:Deoxycytidine triphosphate deaminase n=2 Tax=Oceanisphaera psychrotolerans TaxID=1414654 RepID=A0A1J4QFJ5_9GAMM|nr:deoxycytidine triphosphate deaminase [Oceanisphaera psychrotolerans]
MDKQTQTELEAAAFRTLLAHLDKRKDVQNIDLMNLAGFCRNCLSKWYLAAAEEQGVELNYDQARERVYGMPYDEWKAKYQQEATPEQQAAFARSQKHD